MQLIINTFGTSLRRKGDRFLVKSGDRQVAFSAHKIQSIVVATGAHFSSNVIQLACQHNIDIVFLDKYGQPTARVWQTKMGSTAAIRRRQLESADTNEGLTFVSQWTISKVRNQQRFLEELRQRRPERDEVFAAPVAMLSDCCDKLAALEGTVEQQRGTIMGLEGSAGRAYFRCLGALMPAEYQFQGRSRQPAVDPFNAMLNYSYGVLYSLVERACILAGLDPFVGFLHTDNYNKKSLVFDMIEPFRTIAERTTVLFFTGRRVKREFFREVPGGIELAPDGRAALLTELNKRLDRTVRYPVQTRPFHSPAGSRLTASPTACASSDDANETRRASEETHETQDVNDATNETRRVSEETPEPPLPRGADGGEAKQSTPKQTRKPKKKFRKVKQRAVIQHEAHALANALLGRDDIPRIVETEDIWKEENDK
jgi:CRISPR-associated protein Cas1